jgi:hypothetical protein
VETHRYHREVIVDYRPINPGHHVHRFRYIDDDSQGGLLVINYGIGVFEGKFDHFSSPRTMATSGLPKQDKDGHAANTQLYYILNFICLCSSLIQIDRSSLKQFM